ncbi:MAG TPA: iron-sulfur cluster assembly accessory protein [Thermoplasmata archaeon]|jgi:iron-sulfur cluster assembly accessory protein|nr:iron-sulfur cluster assembly accessory protein [Thermoplasmata archaeon]
MIHIEIRPAAVDQVKTLIRGQKPEIGVRVYAQPGGGGCGGGSSVQFGLAFAKPRSDDEVLRIDGFALLIDPSSTKFVDGAVIDYVEDLNQSGFKITNPTLPEPDANGRSGGCGSCGSNSANGGGCGCGH